MEFRRKDGSNSPPLFRESAFTKPLPSYSSSFLSPGGGGGGGGGGGESLSTDPASNSHPESGSTEPISHTEPVYPDAAPIPPPPSSSAGAAGVNGEHVGVGGGATGLNSRPSATPITINITSTNAAVEAGKYKECLRNHAASVGGHVVDGCGEFMPCGSSEPMKCAACGCHRSFHRKELQGYSGGDHYYRHHNGTRIPLLLPPPPPPPPQSYIPPSHAHHHKVFSPGFLPSPSSAMAFAANRSRSGGTTTESSSEERNGGNPMGATPPSVVSKKRFRTKFTAEQKEKMLGFAESVGWRVQRQGDTATERFCSEIGVSRQVLKVWMHNNKQSMKKQQQQQQQQEAEQQQQEPQQPQHQEQQSYKKE